MNVSVNGFFFVFRAMYPELTTSNILHHINKQTSSTLLVLNLLTFQMTNAEQMRHPTGPDGRTAGVVSLVFFGSMNLSAFVVLLPRRLGCRLWLSQWKIVLRDPHQARCLLLWKTMSKKATGEVLWSRGDRRCPTSLPYRTINKRTSGAPFPETLAWQDGKQRCSSSCHVAGKIMKKAGKS